MRKFLILFLIISSSVFSFSQKRSIEFFGRNNYYEKKSFEVYEHQKIYLQLKNDSTWYKGEIVIIDSLHFKLDSMSSLIEISKDNLHKVSRRKSTNRVIFSIIGGAIGFYGTIGYLSKHDDGGIFKNVMQLYDVDPNGYGNFVLFLLSTYSAGTAIGFGIGYALDNLMVHENAIEVESFKVIKN